MLEKAFKLYLNIESRLDGGILNWGFFEVLPCQSQKVMSWQLIKIECTRFRQQFET